MLSKGQYTVKTRDRVSWYSVYTSNPLNTVYNFFSWWNIYSMGTKRMSWK